MHKDVIGCAPVPSKPVEYKMASGWYICSGSPTRIFNHRYLLVSVHPHIYEKKPI